MKTKILFSAISLLFTTFNTALAQDESFGVKAGINYSTQSGNEGGEIDYLIGFHAGLISEFRLFQKFSLQPELLYSLEGGQANYDYSIGEANFSSEQKFKLGYINLPVMGKYYVIPALSLQAGPQIGYLISARREYDSSSLLPGKPVSRESGTEDLKHELKKISLGLTFGLGYEFQNNIFLQARYYLGLSDINNYDDQVDEFELDFENIRNRGFQLSLGYQF